MTTPESSTAAGYELKDIPLKGIFYATLILLGSLVAIVFLLKPIFGINLRKHIVTTYDHAVTNVFPAPKLQRYPGLDWEEFHAAEMEQLTTYGWVDRSKGIVRVPIKEAMDMYLKRQEPTATKGEP